MTNTIFCPYVPPTVCFLLFASTATLIPSLPLSSHHHQSLFPIIHRQQDITRTMLSLCWGAFQTSSGDVQQRWDRGDLLLKMR